MSSTNFTDEDMVRLKKNKEACIKMREDAGLYRTPIGPWGDVYEVVRLQKQLKVLEDAVTTAITSLCYGKNPISVAINLNTARGEANAIKNSETG